MTKEENIQYLNDTIENNNKYEGPTSLFKYRAFDKYSFDMLENNYIFLCPAKDLDDESECTTTFNKNNIYNEEKDYLNPICIELIFDMVEPYTTEENYNIVKSLVYRCLNNQGIISGKRLLDYRNELENYIPNDKIPDFVNIFMQIPNFFKDNANAEQFNSLLSLAYNAKEVIGICSFSEDNNNELLWENYGSNNTGYCIEYDVSNYEYNKNILPTIYTDQRDTDIVIQLTASIISKLIKQLSEKKLKPDETQFIQLFLTKNTNWSYQKEWRYVGLANEHAQAPKIKRIYLGHDVSKENEEKMIEYANRNGIEIIKM